MSKNNFDTIRHKKLKWFLNSKHSSTKNCTDIEIDRKMGHKAKKSIFYLAESNGNHETLLTISVPRRYFSGAERTGH